MNKLGVMIVLTAGTDILPEMKKAKEIGCECCQLCVWDPTLYTDLLAEEIVGASKETEIEVSTLWAGWSGAKEWNFTGGPVTLGLVPEAYRMKRTEEVLAGVDFAVKIGCSRVATGERERSTVWWPDRDPALYRSVLQEEGYQLSV